jgi:hypothetical protein
MDSHPRVRDGELVFLSPSYEPVVGLYALLVVEPDGAQWTVMLEPHEFDAIAQRAAGSRPTLRHIVSEVTGRRPDVIDPGAQAA